MVGCEVAKNALSLEMDMLDLLLSIWPNLLLLIPIESEEKQSSSVTADSSSASKDSSGAVYERLFLKNKKVNVVNPKLANI